MKIKNVNSDNFLEKKLIKLIENVQIYFNFFTDYLNLKKK